MVSGGKDDRSIPAVTGRVDGGELGDVVMGCWVGNRVDIVGSKVDLELTRAVVEETASVTVVGFKDVSVELTKAFVDVDIEVTGVLGFIDVLGAFVDMKDSALVVSMLLESTVEDDGSDVVVI